MRFGHIVRWILIRCDPWDVASGTAICSFFTWEVATIKSGFIKTRPRMDRCWWKMTTRWWFVATWWRLRMFIRFFIFCPESNSSFFSIVSSRIQIFKLCSDIIQRNTTTGQFGNFFWYTQWFVYICRCNFLISSSSQIRCRSNTLRFYQSSANRYCFKTNIFLKNFVNFS